MARPSQDTQPITNPSLAAAEALGAIPDSGVAVGDKAPEVTVKTITAALAQWVPLHAEGIREKRLGGKGDRPGKVVKRTAVMFEDRVTDDGDGWGIEVHNVSTGLPVKGWVSKSAPFEDIIHGFKMFIQDHRTGERPG